VLAPSTCSACGELENERVFCATCGAPAPSDPSDVDGVPVFTAGRYAPPLSDAIRRFKFEGHPELARPLARLVLPVLEELELEHTDAWVPVPLHRSRLVERGFNQSALLARILAKSTGSRFAPRTLERRRETEQQARLGRVARAHNAFGAFIVRRPVAAERVVLVDDVVTTGATARACLAALREANVAVLAVVALAQAAR
jgi:ComF family protein